MTSAGGTLAVQKNLSPLRGLEEMSWWFVPHSWRYGLTSDAPTELRKAKERKWRARPTGLQGGNACWIGTADGGHRRIMVVMGHLFQAVGCGAGIIIEKDQDFAVGLAGGLIALAAGLQAPREDDLHLIRGPVELINIIQAKGAGIVRPGRNNDR